MVTVQTPESAEDFIVRKSATWTAERDRLLRFKDIGRRGTHDWIREAWTWHVQSNYAEKAIVLERLRHIGRSGERALAGGAAQGDIEYRLGYYIVGRVGRAAGRWVWGQFSLLIPEQDLRILLDKARADGTLRI